MLEPSPSTSLWSKLLRWMSRRRPVYDNEVHREFWTAKGRSPLPLSVTSAPVAPSFSLPREGRVRSGSPTSWGELWDASDENLAANDRFKEFVLCDDAQHRAERWLLTKGRRQR